MSAPIIFNTTGPVASITFNRPEKANALLPEWANQMKEFYHQVENDPDVRCILIKANGKNFMAGGDLDPLKEVLTMTREEKGARFESDVYGWNNMIRTMRRCPKPIVVSVQGAVAGAAVGLVSACDLIMASSSAFFFLAHILHGMSNDGMASYFLPRQIGVHKTLELALLGGRITAKEAKEMGFVNFVVDDDQLELETEKLVNRLASGPTVGYGLIKNLIRSSLENSLEEQGRLEAESIAASAQTEDWLAGISAFLEKRKPEFKGR
jgi:2-(1,2-epoxy-1,2-dihydrophenyl)acetyl-CoA isomerase